VTTAQLFGGPHDGAHHDLAFATDMVILGDGSHYTKSAQGWTHPLPEKGGPPTPALRYDYLRPEEIEHHDPTDDE
jgi:hypothetical protein